MRYIDITGLLRKRRRWGHRAELWRNKNLQDDFRLYFYNKCWYTEAPLIGQDVHIDHFRPKNEVKKYKDYNYNEPIRDNGYTWLKNEPSNYRACCIYANRVTDGGGKGCFFPLKEDSQYMTKHGTETEQPLLLDPCDQEDVKLLSFFGKNVLCTSTDDVDKVRVEVSSNIYNLTNRFIETDRAKVWEEVSKTLAEYESGEISQRACLRRLADTVNRDACFSACAIACVRSLADDDIKVSLNLEL